MGKTATGKSMGRRGLRSRHRKEALQWMRLLWGFFHFLESGSPCNAAVARAVSERASRGMWTATHESYARTMFARVLKYVTHPRRTMDRGTAKLNDLISRIRVSKYDPSQPFEEALPGAKPVDPNRISLPTQAAIINPADHLTGKRLAEFVTSLCTAKDPKPCHKVDPDDWPTFLKKLHDANIIVFLPWDEVLREGGKPVKGGLFCVAHKISSDRLINDRRPLNAREHRLKWCDLPKDPSESVRGSGDDLSNYFYVPAKWFVWEIQMGLEPPTKLCCSQRAA